ncbi:uncharacterized protein BDR25DRAFT_353894 [Lindgomyces ingoldianus]|uniref:Uncharacterized protein n=1 Tax=Lindgomyces ingoldianus TaxID=673940 RepID=A0ACB6QYP7_9PLEO|nr:uncharacterized protein BDR25DRAFT_353894 [Lindgomyces ingoldianus]KAF2472174.1 hypothetical protein BDR25DRAFT_353894 [Lindgomyces ingoldianus]
MPLQFLRFYTLCQFDLGEPRRGILKHSHGLYKKATSKFSFWRKRSAFSVSDSLSTTDQNRSYRVFGSSLHTISLDISISTRLSARRSPKNNSSLLLNLLNHLYSHRALLQRPRLSPIHSSLNASLLFGSARSCLWAAKGWVLLLANGVPTYLCLSLLRKNNSVVRRGVKEKYLLLWQVRRDMMSVGTILEQEFRYLTFVSVPTRVILKPSEGDGLESCLDLVFRLFTIVPNTVVLLYQPDIHHSKWSHQRQVGGSYSALTLTLETRSSTELFELKMTYSADDARVYRDGDNNYALSGQYEGSILTINGLQCNNSRIIPLGYRPDFWTEMWGCESKRWTLSKFGDVIDGGVKTNKLNKMTWTGILPVLFCLSFSTLAPSHLTWNMARVIQGSTSRKLPFPNAPDLKGVNSSSSSPGLIRIGNLPPAPTSPTKPDMFRLFPAEHIVTNTTLSRKYSFKQLTVWP